VTPDKASCKELDALLQTRLKGLPVSDALDLFLAIHLCVCREVEKNGTPALKLFNQHFVGRTIEAYNRHLTFANRGSHLGLPDEWEDALADYYKHKTDILADVTLLLSAHFVADLIPLLCKMDLYKSDYDSVLKYVAGCIDKDGNPLRLGRGVVDRVGALVWEAFRPLVPPLTLGIARQLAWQIARHRRANGNCQDWYDTHP
jgi:hypothetical protein